VLSVFICYRRTDGAAVAAWLHDRLGSSGGRLKAYFDVNAAAVHDWTELHQQALQSADALLVVVTPGLYANFGAKDWVHRELRWWTENRRTAPIVVDTTGEGERWLPDGLRKRWPNIQRVELKASTRLDEPEPTLVQRELARIRAGIEANETSDDLVQMVAGRNRTRLVMTLVAVAALVAMVTSVAYAMMAYNERKLLALNAEIARLKSERLKEQEPNVAQYTQLEERRAEDPQLFRPGDVKLWPNRTTLRVSFLDGDADQQMVVLRAFDEWLKYANLEVQATPGKTSMIRVSFVEPEGSWSFIGTDALGAKADTPTMMLGYMAENRPIPYNVLHEVGHALGLVHEMSNPQAELPWDKPSAYRILTGAPNFWSRQQVDDNLFSPSGAYPGSRPFDRASIMLNELPADYFIDRVGLKPGLGLSDSDKQYIASLYPGRYKE
jgi:serralysin